jgi:type IV secretion system protein VirD4
MTADTLGDDAFETALKRDLPRGVTKKAQAYGYERGLSARWLVPNEMAGDNWEHNGGVLLGTRQGRTIGWKDDRHLLTIAGSRAGKGVSLIIPNLIFYEGSAVVVDPKGENAARTARQRGKGPLAGGTGLGQDVYVLDPFGESGLPSDAFNPLHNLKATDPLIVEVDLPRFGGVV